jgi:pimeloyl-ACP methyl ester carboxylesterase
MKGDFAADEAVTFEQGSAIDTTEAYYRGSSQGGIFGATYMALSTDVTRGVLDVPGAPYNLLLNRSVDFDPFNVVLRIKYPSGRDAQIVLGLVQMLWDRVEPNGYLPFVRENPLPGTPSHEVLLHVAIGDHQVTPLGAHYMARTMGAPLIAPATRPVFGLEEERAPFEGSAIVEFDFGDLVDPLPDTNVPTDSELDDPHGWPRSLAAQIEQSDVFLRTGVVTHTCDGACDPE